MKNAPLHTFVFADMVGYTSFTADHGDDAAADLATAFCLEVSRLAADHGAEIIKSIGDAVMVRVPDATNAVTLAVQVLDELSGRRGFLPIRIGMHTGPAVERTGDWFGATVNVAARVAAAAAGGEALATIDTCTAVSMTTSVDLQARGPHVFKNVVEKTLVYAIAPGRARPRAEDVVERRHRRSAPAMKPLPAIAAAAEV